MRAIAKGKGVGNLKIAFWRSLSPYRGWKSTTKNFTRSLI